MEADVATHKIVPTTTRVANGGTQSAPVYVKDAITGYVQNPAVVTGGALAFEISEDGANFFAGVPAISVALGVAANARVPIPAAALCGRYMRLVVPTAGQITDFTVYLKA